MKTINTPLTEQAYTERTFYEPITRFSSDGLFLFVHKPLKSIRFTDALGFEAVLNFKDKPR